RRHAPHAELWILCMDEQVEGQLRQLALAHVHLLPLREVENEALLSVKPGRGRGEYCWTLTPFVFDAVFARAGSATRVTYLDADLYFYRDPTRLLEELDRSGKHVLITEHAYAPEYDQSAKVGRFCVQFLTVRNTEAGRAVTSWWQQRCLEWCFHRHEDGKYGDQKYLDAWPTLFAEQVHILEQVHETLGPWNVRRLIGAEAPTFYHFHGLRITAPTRVQLYNGYRIGGGARLYDSYMQALRGASETLHAHGMAMPTLPQTSLRDRLKLLKNLALGRYMERTL
ncbi:MAG: glycosyl transferase, partial [Polyangiales bacterium]